MVQNFFFAVRIEKLGNCDKLKSVNLSGNKIDYISNLESCTQLWRIDLSNNKVSSCNVAMLKALFKYSVPVVI